MAVWRRGPAETLGLSVSFCRMGIIPVKRPMKQLILISAIAVVFISAQTTNTGSLEGRVTDDENFLPIAGATVALASNAKPKRSVRITTTNADGYFKMDGITPNELIPGGYVLVVTHPNFSGQREYIKTTILFDSRGPAKFSFTLKPLRRLTKDFPQFFDQPLP